MKAKKLFLAMCLLMAGAASAQAQDYPVDYTKYPDYSPLLNPDESFYTYGQGPRANTKGAKRAAAVSQRPDHVDNSQKMYFPPVFNQAGGSCGSASRICYMFTWELNAYRGLNGKDPNNYYPSHFVWLLTNGNSGKDQFVQFVGVPSAALYGGQTYSSQFGYQDTGDENFGWMQGYDKWYAGMFNRMWAPAHIPVNVGTEEGREMLKNWLWNHNGDSDFHAGGVAGIGVASGGNWQPIPKTAVNDELGVTKKYYVKAWGTSVDHALTIVGYDDRIEFDLDGNGVCGEKDKDEVGAWIVVNSWGAGWCNNGFIYCPYKHAVTAFTGDGKSNGSFYAPEIYHVRKDYKPERTIKLKMDYNRRSEIALSAGISTNLDATEPDQTIPFHHFQYAGDGHNGNSNPAPEVPMLGKWADGKMHTEPMEFGYDLTDLTAGANRNMPIKYFFIVNTKSWAQGNGHIYEASIMDYKLDPEGIEIPFDCSDENPIEIKSSGKKTIISVIVHGDGYTSPRNLTLSEDGLMSWDAPSRTGHALDSYNVYVDGVKIANTKKTSYQFDTITGNVYSLTALYTDGNETQPVSVNAPVVKAEQQTVYEFTKSGFSIPDVFKSNYSECTIEFLIRPKSLLNWNQSAGPGWGTFMMHANSNGSFTAGWDTSDRCSSASSSLKTGSWTHVAIVINKKSLKIYINGSSSASMTAANHSGIGGFGDFTFTANSGNNSYTDAYIDELRIWNHARTSTQITKNKYVEFSGAMLPDGLLAYYKGGTFSKDGSYYMTDVAGGHHARVLNDGFKTSTSVTRNLTNPTETTSLKINSITGDVIAGMPIEFSAKSSTNIRRTVWTCEEAGMDSTAVTRPTIIFPAPGTYTVKVTGFTYKNEMVEDQLTVEAKEASEPIDASFIVGNKTIPAGDHVTFRPTSAKVGYVYMWDMPGARKESAGSMIAGATYDMYGTYPVTLTVTSPSGASASTTQEVTVTKVAPKSDFRVSPSVILKGDTTYLIDESKHDPSNWKWSINSKSQDYIVKGQNSSFVPEVAGIYDVSLTTTNEIGQHTATQTQALYVCNADSKNGLNFVGYNNAKVTAPNPFETPSAFTFEFWLEQNTLSDFCNGMGDEDNTINTKISQAGALVLYVNGSSIASNDGFILTSGWHHYAVTYATNGNVYFYRDGEKHTGTWMKKTIPAMNKFRIGGSDLPFTGRIDELRVWNKALTQAQIRKYCVEPITNIEEEEKNGLRLYYDFNQSSGDVVDRTSNGYNGVRTGFGPEGDAWGMSLGVFALCFDTKDVKTVTSSYLTNFKKPFTKASTTVNNSVASRFYNIRSWVLENQTVNGAITTGVHVDTQKASCFTCTSGWDGFGDVVDHKAFQRLTLPAGIYTFTASYDDSYEGQCGNSYLVAAKGSTLPETADLSEAIAFQGMQPKSASVTENSLTFELYEETEVSLGLLINQTGKQCMTIKQFALQQVDTDIKEADGKTPSFADGIVAPASTDSNRPAATYDLQGRRIQSPTKPGLYIIGGKKVVIK